MVKPHIGTRLRPIVRVFVSSTFSDLRLERDALQERVFPKLEQLCLKAGFQFQAIDLRWGVSTEAGLDHRTMRICFEELRRSQEVSPEPNFLILLGSRYGWRPLPEEISEDEFGKLMKHTSSDDEKNVLRNWYRLDTNAIPPAYLLRARTDSPDGHDYTKNSAPDGEMNDTESWLVVQEALWGIVNRAFPASGLQDRFASVPAATGNLPSIVRFQASATEQEIWAGALSVPNARQHVLAFCRGISTCDVRCGPTGVKAYFDLTKSDTLDTQAQDAQNALKQALKQRLGNNAIELSAAHLVPTKNAGGLATVSPDHIDELCVEVETRLKDIINRQIEDWHEIKTSGSASTVPTSDKHSARELEIEVDEHIRFGAERAPNGGFIGRETEIANINSYLTGEVRRPLVVYGPSGTGKTALLAHVALADVTPVGKPIPRGRALTMVRFLGTTPASSTVRSLLTSLCRQLRQHFPLIHEMPTALHELQNEFHHHLARASSERPIHLFLDALDQLDDADAGRQIDWLRVSQSQTLPAHVKLIVSCLSDAGDAAAGQPFRRFSHTDLLKSGVKLDELTADEAVRLLLDHWLKPTLTDDLGRPGRTLSRLQRQALEKHIRRPVATLCRRPLYLKILFEEARLWHSYDAPPGDLPNSVEGLLKQLVDRLSLEVNHGPILLKRALGYIAAARRGLSETEVVEILFADDPGYKTYLDSESKRNNHTLPTLPPRIPIAIWSRLRSDLAPYLTERAAPGGNVVTFYHRQVAEWINSRSADESDWNAHGRSAEFFGKQNYFLESLEEQRIRTERFPPTPRLANIRKVDELPYHVLEVAKRADPKSENPAAQEWDAVANVLTDGQLLEAKSEGGLTFGLVHDFSAAITVMPQSHPRYRILSLLEEAIRRDIHFLDRHPTAMFQCMWNLCWWYDAMKASSHYSTVGGPWMKKGVKLSELMEDWKNSKYEQTPRFCWLRSLRPLPWPLGEALIASLRQHKSSILGIVYSPDGRSMATASADDTIRIWDLASSSELTCLPMRRVKTMAYSPSADRLLCGDSSGGVSFIDPATGSVMPIWHSDDEVVSVFYSLKGEAFGSIDTNGCIRIWTSEDKRELLVHQLETRILQAAFSPVRNSLATTSMDGEVRLWSLATAVEVASFKVDNGSVTSVEFSPDGRILAVGTDLGEVSVFDVDRRELAMSLRPSLGEFQQREWIRGAHIPFVVSLAISPDSRLLAAGSYDQSVRVYDLSRQQEVSTLEGHDGPVERLCLSPNGHLLASGSIDGVRIWDLRKMSKALQLRGHANWITTVAFSHDGAMLASSSMDRTVRLWGTRTAQELTCFKSDCSATCVAFSPDDTLLAVAALGRAKHEVHIWDIRLRQRILCLPVTGKKICSVAFSSNGTSLAVGSEDGHVRTWSIPSGNSIGSLLEEAEISCVCCSTSGKLVGCGLKSQAVSVWDVDSGKQIARLDHKDDATEIQFDNGEERLSIRGRDGRAWTWDLATDTCTTLASDDAHPPTEDPRETAIVGESSEDVVGWFPFKLVNRANQRTNALVAGSTSFGNHLFLLKIEGRQ